MRTARPVVVVGGGLAGIAAALTLGRAGVPTLLLDSRQVLGGRVRSFGDPERDNGQHVFLGCCERLIRLLDTLGLGAETTLQERARVPVVDIHGRIGLLGSRGPLDAVGPLAALASYRHLNAWERASALWAAARLDGEARAAETEGRGGAFRTGLFSDWLREHRQGPRARRYFWDLLTTPTLNAAPERVSTAAAAFVLRKALFGGPDTLRVGWARSALSAWIHGAALRSLSSLGLEVRLRHKVHRIVFGGEHVIGVECPQGTIETGRIVLALPPHRLRSILPDRLAKRPPFSSAGRIESSAIVGVHLRFDRPIGAPEILATPDSPLEWIFNTTRIRGAEAETEAEQELSIVLSDAGRWLPLTADRIIACMREALPLVLPEAGSARLVDAKVHREPHATIVPSPRTEKLRPPQATEIPGLTLAGAWTDTGGWPSTMEGAVVSGERAARAIIQDPPPNACPSRANLGLSRGTAPI